MSVDKSCQTINACW